MREKMAERIRSQDHDMQKSHEPVPQCAVSKLEGELHVNIRGRELFSGAGQS